MKGCGFHWSQAVFRQIQHRGLQTEYCTHEGMFTFCLRMLALPYLPATHIPDMFLYLKGKSVERTDQLVNYIERTWIESFVWPPVLVSIQ